MKKLSLFFVPGLMLLAIPVVTFADVATPGNLGQLANLFVSMIRDLILPLLASMTILAFLWGAGQFIGKAGDKASHEKGKSMLTWGVIGLFLFVTIYGILSFLYNDFGFTSNSGNAHPNGFLLTLPQ